MKRFFNFGATALAAFYDFAVGCLIATFVMLAFGQHFPWWFIALEGFVFGLFPDFDLYLPMPVRRWIGGDGAAHHHESALHWPMVTLPVIGFLTFLAGVATAIWWPSSFKGTVSVGITALLSILAHYIHDATIMGWEEGREWFFRDKCAHWTRLGTIEPADPDHQHWREKNWLRLSRLSAVELSLGSIALGIAFAILTGYILNGLLLMFLIWAGIISFWQGYERLPAVQK